MTQAQTSASSATTSGGTDLRALWHWWSGELKTMLPASVARWLEGDAIATDVAIDEHGLTIITRDLAAAKAVPHRVASDSVATSPILRDLIATGRDRVRLLLTAEQALVKPITLPLATEENLREVVGFELDRHTPFTPAQAVYDVQVIKRDAQNEKISVMLAVASRSEVAGLLATLRRAGLTCTTIGVSDAGSGELKAFDLQPASDKPPRRLSRTHQINLGLLALSALLALAAVILPIWQKREIVKVLYPQAEKSQAEFQVSERVYSDYVKLAAEYNFLATRKHAVHPVLAVIEELARTFGDTTWIQSLNIKVNGKVREVNMIGETQSSSKVIENIEQSPTALFQNSKQVNAFTKMQANTERFHVTAEVKPRTVPPLESIDDVAVAAATIASPVPPSATPQATPAGSAAAPGGTPTASVNPAAPNMMTPMQPVAPALPAGASAPTPTPMSPSNVPPSAPSSAPVAKKSGS